MCIRDRVKAYDSEGLESGYTTSAIRTVRYNVAPAINASSTSLGEKMCIRDRSLLDEGYEKFCEYVERYEREKRRTQYGTCLLYTSHEAGQQHDGV